MWTDIKNNNNKYYLIQVIQNTSTKKYAAWNRWGRVGVDGANAIRHSNDAQTAINDYNKKYRDKTSKGYTAI